MAIKVGINGFGRIGRVVLRIMIEHPEQFDICGINLRKADLDYMVYMIKYDSVFRQFNGTVEHKDKNLIVNGHTIQVFSESDAAMIPWSTTTLPSTSLSAEISVVGILASSPPPTNSALAAALAFSASSSP